MEADFVRFYSLDLDYEVQTRSVRSLWALVKGLPPEAALHRGTDAGWTDELELLSMIAQALGVKIKRKRPPKILSVSEFASMQAKGGEG